jgi:hypothetical protein
MVARLVLFAGSYLFLVPAYPHAQGVSIIEFQQVQFARSLAAVVHDPADSAKAGVLVEEFTSDWKESLSSTMTDAAGRFTFVPVKAATFIISNSQ